MTMTSNTERFALYSTADLAAQCRMQARDGLDPELSAFMTAVADRLDGLVESSQAAKEPRVTDAEIYLRSGLQYPYDRVKPSKGKSAARPWQEKAVLGILNSLMDRKGIKHEFHNVDMDVRQEMVRELAEIVKLAAPT